MKVVILGAGISGLALAWFLKQQHGTNVTITILEKTDRVGGWIQSKEINDFLFELGPHSCRTQGNGIATLSLIEDLGLQDQVIVPATFQRYLQIDQQLIPIPHNLRSCFKSPLMKGVPTALCRDFFSSAGTAEDESIKAFCERRFGKEITQRLIDPLISGIYAGDINQLSVQSCFPQWKESEQRYGSVLRGMFRRKSDNLQTSAWQKQIMKSPCFSFRKGLSTLTETLESKLNEHIVTNCTISHLDFHVDGVVVHASDGKCWHADHIYSTIPPGALAALLVCHRPAISILLQRIINATVAIASMGYKNSVLGQQGFGYLIPSKEHEEILGMIWDSSIFPQQNHYSKETRLTVMMGGTRYPNLPFKDDNELSDIALNAVDRHLKISKKPNVIFISRAKRAIPQYQVGHKKLIDRIKLGVADLSPHITLLGPAFNGVSINDCIAAAKKVK